jgi:hypothetical protein
MKIAVSESVIKVAQMAIKKAVYPYFPSGCYVHQFISITHSLTHDSSFWTSFSRQGVSKINPRFWEYRKPKQTEVPYQPQQIVSVQWLGILLLFERTRVQITVQTWATLSYFLLLKSKQMPYRHIFSYATISSVHILSNSLRQFAYNPIIRATDSVVK